MPKGCRANRSLNSLLGGTTNADDVKGNIHMKHLTVQLQTNFGPISQLLSCYLNIGNRH